MSSHSLKLKQSKTLGSLRGGTFFMLAGSLYLKLAYLVHRHPHDCTAVCVATGAATPIPDHELVIPASEFYYFT